MAKEKTLAQRLKDLNKRLEEGSKKLEKHTKELSREAEALKKKRLEKEYYERYEKQFPIDNSNRAGGRK